MEKGVAAELQELCIKEGRKRKVYSSLDHRLFAKLKKKMPMMMKEVR